MLSCSEPEASCFIKFGLEKAVASCKEAGRIISFSNLPAWSDKGLLDSSIWPELFLLLAHIWVCILCWDLFHGKMGRPIGSGEGDDGTNFCSESVAFCSKRLTLPKKGSSCSSSSSLPASESVSQASCLSWEASAFSDLIDGRRLFIAVFDTLFWVSFCGTDVWTGAQFRGTASSSVSFFLDSLSCGGVLGWLADAFDSLFWGMNDIDFCFTVVFATQDCSSCNVNNFTSAVLCPITMMFSKISGLRDDYIHSDHVEIQLTRDENKNLHRVKSVVVSIIHRGRAACYMRSRTNLCQCSSVHKEARVRNSWFCTIWVADHLSTSFQGFFFFCLTSWNVSKKSCRWNCNTLSSTCSERCELDWTKAQFCENDFSIMTLI